MSARANGRRGRGAERPSKIDPRGWRDISTRVWREVQRDNLTIVAAGVAFYAFFAVFPALAALVAIYGLVADPQQAQQQIAAMSGILPGAARDILGQQMQRVSGGSGSALGWGVALSTLLLVWSANKGMNGLVKALNIAYDEEDERGFFTRNALTLSLTLGAIVTAVVAIALVVVLPPLLGTLGLGSAGQTAVRVVRWPLLAAVVLVGLGVVYRFGPDRDRPRWRWVTPGSLTATVLWVLASIGFSIYVSNFGSYGETFGALGGVAILLMWFFLSALVILVGAELNAEAEHQTERDTTAGPPEPIGERGAYHADRVAGRPS